MVERIILGTAQFGLDYGISNPRGRVPEEEVGVILDDAWAQGVTMLDTAAAYGASETVVGAYLARTGHPFRVISKLAPGTQPDDVEAQCRASRARLNRTTLYAYLVHAMHDLRKTPALWQAMRRLKDQGWVQKIGVSAYHPGDLEWADACGIEYEIVQVPYSVFDQRFGPMLEQLEEREVETHVRSVFLQGLVFKAPETLHGVLRRARKNLRQLRACARDLDLPVSAVCLAFALRNPCVDCVVIGVHHRDHLREHVQRLPRLDAVRRVYEALKALHIPDEQVILPFNW